jgi:predicted transcriptional regulator
MTAWGSKRSRLEIYLDVMKVLHRGESRPTRIMYQANLSWKPLMQILENLMKQEIIVGSLDHGHAVYRLTKKGFDILEYFSKMELEIV